jgi:hypothetical protein
MWNAKYPKNIYPHDPNRDEEIIIMIIEIFS